MYKKVLQNIKIQKKQTETTDLWKKEEDHAIHGKLPHFIFSAENPLHPTDSSMTHEQVLDLLKDKGYRAEEMRGKYGEEERSILVHNPPKNSFRHLNNLATSLGQDSAIISDGHDHEMHYLNGTQAGRHYKGSGTVFHRDEPEDYYSTLADGTHFAHEFDTEKTHKDSKFIKDIAGSIKKSESFVRNGIFNLKKTEEKSHKLDNAGVGTKLIHYSPHEGLEEINPEHHGIRRIGSEVKQGVPDHKMSFYYSEGTKPETVVTSGSKHKYVADLGDKKIYDIAKDKDGMHSKVMEKLQAEANKRPINRGIVNSQEKKKAFHGAIRDAGYHGIYNSGLDETMSNVVGMFESMKPESSHKIHPNDFKEASSKNHHESDEKKSKAKEFAANEGHHNHKFLHNLGEGLNE